jgi:uncharacterized damage-inducible protein DinB
MNPREFYVQRRKSEHPAFLKVLKAIPPTQASYKPHDRSPSAAEIVWTLTRELRTCLEAVNDGRGEWRTDAAPPLDQMVEQFERWSADLTDRVATMDDSAWDRVIPFFYNGRQVNEQPVGQFLWFILFDAIHHRGQLTAYLRPMGAKVPAIYGPSADERPT